MRHPLVAIRPRFLSLRVFWFPSLLAAALLAARGAPAPDLTRGEPVPEGFTHDWNLGPTGLRGWMYSHKLVTTEARQIRITRVEPGSPAEGLIAEGDVLLGTGGGLFTFDPRTELGRAIGVAESERGGGRLTLTRWRAGQVEPVTLQLLVLGDYAATAPYRCPKSRRILEQGLAALAKNVAEPGYAKRQSPIPRALNALALLAGGDPAHLPLVRAEAAWAAEFASGGRHPWFYGYVMIFLSEYILATGDRTVEPGLRRLALATAHGQSAVGSWGHEFARPDGRLNGYGMMNSPGVPLTIGLALAREAGIQEEAVSAAIGRSARLLRFYTGKGAVPYGDHHPWIQTHEDNGKTGMTAVLFNRLGEPAPAAFFTRMAVASHGAERDCGHTGNYFNLLWAMPAVGLGGVEAAGAWMAEFGSWYYDLARRWDGTFAHLGPPEPKPDSYAKWDATGALLLAFALPQGKTALSGRGPAVNPPFSAAEARGLVADGRGWSNLDRNSADGRRSLPELLERLGSWSPVVRERAALELGRRGAEPLPAVIALLGDRRLEARLGACQALLAMKRVAAPAVPRLRETLADPDLWLRVKAAEALAAIGTPAQPAWSELFQALVRGPTADDPRGMEQRFLSFALFDILPASALDGVEPALLREAVKAGLRNEDGRARSSIAKVYTRFDYDQALPLFPAIHEAIVTPSPSGEMFADGVRLRGCELLARLRIREGMDLALDLVDLDRWGEANRTKACLDIIARYGPAAKPMLPRLRQLEQQMLTHRNARLLVKAVEQVRALVQKIESDPAQPAELRSLTL
jgi:hypothetical protein